MLRQTQHKVEVKYAATKKSIVTTKDEKNCKMNVAIEKYVATQRQKLQATTSAGGQR